MLDKYKLIDHGGTADIYDMGDGKVIKLFHEDKSDASIDHEYKTTKKVQRYPFGAPTYMNVLMMNVDVVL